LLKFAPVFDGFNNPNVTIHIIGFLYNYEDFSPCFPAGTTFFHLFRLCCQAYNSMELRYVPRNELPNLNNVATNDAIANQIASTLADVLRLRRATQLTVEDKIGFLAYYYERKKGYKRAQDKKEK